MHATHPAAPHQSMTSDYRRFLTLVHYPLQVGGGRQKNTRLSLLVYMVQSGSDEPAG